MSRKTHQRPCNRTWYPIRSLNSREKDDKAYTKSIRRARKKGSLKGWSWSVRPVPGYMCRIPNGVWRMVFTGETCKQEESYLNDSNPKERLKFLHTISKLAATVLP